MTVSSVGTPAATMVQSVLNLRTQLDDLQRQLGTGELSTTYAGLGANAGLTAGLQNQLSTISSYSDTMTNVGTRLTIAQSVLTDFDTTAQSVKQSAVNSTFSLGATGQTTDQQTAYSNLDQLVTLLNTPAGSRYLFSGTSVNQAPVDTTDHILNGNGAQAGLKTIISQRNQADLGANGLGRLVIPAATTAAAALVGTGATLNPDAGATLSGTQDLSTLSSAGGTLVINGTSISIPATADSTAVLNAINAPSAVAATGVTASLNSSHQLVLHGATGDTQIDIGAGTNGNILTELDVAVGTTTNNVNLLTQGAVTSGQTLSVQIGSNPPNTPASVVFGTGPGQVSTIAELNAALSTLTGGTASVNPANGNLTINAAANPDTITVGGNVNPATFGLPSASAVPTNAVSVSEDVAGSPFGLKLASATTSINGATVTGPSAPPASISVNLGASLPIDGDTVKFTFNLPDGTTQDLTLTATIATPPGANQFAIGATPAAAAANIQQTLTISVRQLAGTSLMAASTVAAGNEFFDADNSNPPLRVAGPPYDTATSLINGSSANTVIWYTGELSSDSARSTATARIDSSTTVSYGMRANEQALRTAVKNVALFAATTYSTTDTNAAGSYAALTQKVAANLDGQPGQQKINDIEADVAAAQTAISTTQHRQTQTQNTLTNLLQSVSGVSQDQVGTELLALQTTLQATLQTTALLLHTSLVNYMPTI